MPSRKPFRNVRALSTLIQRLKRKHHRLEQTIATESRQKLPDFMALQRLKRLRLQVKEQILGIESRLSRIGKPIRPDAA